mgnify:CR=1 FL=1
MKRTLIKLLMSLAIVLLTVSCTNNEEKIQTTETIPILNPISLPETPVLVEENDEIIRPVPWIYLQVSTFEVPFERQLARFDASCLSENHPCEPFDRIETPFELGSGAYLSWAPDLQKAMISDDNEGHSLYHFREENLLFEKLTDKMTIKQWPGIWDNSSRFYFVIEQTENFGSGLVRVDINSGKLVRLYREEFVEMRIIGFLDQKNLLLCVEKLKLGDDGKLAVQFTNLFLIDGFDGALTGYEHSLDLNPGSELLLSPNVQYLGFTCKDRNTVCLFDTKTKQIFDTNVTGHLISWATNSQQVLIENESTIGLYDTLKGQVVISFPKEDSLGHHFCWFEDQFLLDFPTMEWTWADPPIENYLFKEYDLKDGSVKVHALRDLEGKAWNILHALCPCVSQ